MAGPAMKRRRYDRKTWKKDWTKNVPRNIKTNSLVTKRSYVLEPFGVSVSSGWVAVPFQFRLNDIPTYSEFQSLFDSYKINGVKLTFTPYWDSNDLSNQLSSTYTLPRVYTLIDNSGIPAGSIATENQFLEYANARIITDPSKAFTVYVKNPTVETFATSNFSVENKKPWIDLSHPDVIHHGAAMGMVIPAGASTAVFYYNIVATFYLSFKKCQ